MAKEVVLTADKVKKWHRFKRSVSITFLAILICLISMFIVLQIIYSEGNFTVILDSNQTLESGIAIYESLNDPTGKRKLYADSINFMDNISIKWLPENINDEAEGSHNGTNYIAYTFYAENQGDQYLNYWYKIVIDDVIKNVDEAARIMIYQNGVQTVYAKGNSIDREPEKGTVKFRDDDDGTIILVKREAFNPGDLDKFTVVVWIEGDDPECVDALVGGELKMHMDITEEHIG